MEILQIMPVNMVNGQSGFKLMLMENKLVVIPLGKW